MPPSLTFMVNFLDKIRESRTKRNEESEERSEEERGQVL
jgi:hypothetical protein